MSIKLKYEIVHYRILNIIIIVFPTIQLTIEESDILCKLFIKNHTFIPFLFNIIRQSPIIVRIVYVCFPLKDEKSIKDCL